MSADADRLLKRHPVSKKYNIVQKRSYVEPSYRYVAVKQTYPNVCVEISRDLLPIDVCVLAGRSVEWVKWTWRVWIPGFPCWFIKFHAFKALIFNKWNSMLFNDFHAPYEPCSYDGVGQIPDFRCLGSERMPILPVLQGHTKNSPLPPSLQGPCVVLVTFEHFKLFYLLCFYNYFTMHFNK